MSSLGSLEWAESTSGRIDAADRAEMDRRVASLLAVSQQAAAQAVTVRFADIQRPDSALCDAVDELWTDIAPTWLCGHGHRTWYFAKALAAADRIDHDDELLYAAAVLHDLGLTDHAPPTPDRPCFAVSGGLAARDLVQQHRQQHDANLVAEAIVMHLNIDVRLDEGAVHYLVAAGTLIDVTGQRLQRVPEELVTAVLTAHPRGDFGSLVGQALATFGSRFPDTRCGYLHDTLGIANLSTHHPLDTASLRRRSADR